MLLTRDGERVAGVIRAVRHDDSKEEFLAKVRKVCEEAVGPNATSVDDEARNPTDSWDALFDIGVLSMFVPAKLGGLDFDLSTYGLTIRTLARYCAATAMTVHMHSCACRIVSELAGDEQKQRYLGEVVARRTVIGSWASEPNMSLSVKYQNATTITPKGDGYVVNGRKHFCTMAGAADYGLIWARLPEEGTEEDPEYGLAIVANGNPGMKVEGRWNPMGMRGTVSPGVVLEDCEVEADAVLRGVFNAKLADLLGLGFAMVMLGVTENVVDKTVSHVQKKTLAGVGSVAESDNVQRRVGALAAAAHVATLTVMDAAERWEAADAKDRAALTSIAKLVAGQSALDVTRDAMELVGGVSAVKHLLPIERAYRDVRTASLMPPNQERMLITIGRDELGQDASNLP